MITVRVARDGREVQITHHALRRWQERVYPDDTLEAATSRLRDKVKDSGRITKKRPKWAHRTGDLKHRILTEGYLVVNQPREPGKIRLEVAFPLTINALTANSHGLIATTALVQGYDRDR